MTDLVASVPTELGWGLIVALLVRGLLAAMPRILDAASRALTERATAQRLAAQAQLTEAETERADHDELRKTRERIDQLEQRLREQEHACGVEIEAAHALHRTTRDRVDAMERLHTDCQAQLRALHQELEEVRASISSQHTT